VLIEQQLSCANGGAKVVLDFWDGARFLSGFDRYYPVKSGKRVRGKPRVY